MASPRPRSGRPTGSTGGIGKANLRFACYRPPVPKKPKSKCCVDKPRCKRCPIRMLAEGTLPEGYTVKKRKLVKAKKGDKVRLAA